MANYLERIFDDFKELARSKRKENKKFFARLSKHEGKKLNAQFHAMHEEVFAETDCLKCARCCRATGPLLTKQDIARISKKQGIKAADFEARYLRVDEDGDWVMNSLPCPFLALDTNKCTIYEYAPKACRQFPHTDHPNMKSILPLTETNVRHCPAVYEMVERMKLSADI
ncbi:YkgJ family cysteine cluster protein [Schleiferiaceae bacterium]|nr:YkgJ family cysteine cluster protein [Schleiferiaceae bacterium]